MCEVEVEQASGIGVAEDGDASGTDDGERRGERAQRGSENVVARLQSGGAQGDFDGVHAIGGADGVRNLPCIGEILFEGSDFLTKDVPSGCADSCAGVEDIAAAVLPLGGEVVVEDHEWRGAGSGIGTGVGGVCRIVGEGTDDAGGVSGDEGVRGDVAGDNGTGGDHGAGTDFDTWEDSGIGSDGGSVAEDDGEVLSWLLSAAGEAVIAESGIGADEDIVFDAHGVPDLHAALYGDAVADDDIVFDEDMVTDIAVGSDDGVREDVSEGPDAGAGADARGLADGSRMDARGIGHGGCVIRDVGGVKVRIGCWREKGVT